MLPMARMTDLFADNDTVAAGSGTVFINNLPAARLTDQTTGHGPPPCYWGPVPIVSGSATVFINNLPAIGLTAAHATHACGPAIHDSAVSGGSGTVFVG